MTELEKNQSENALTQALATSHFLLIVMHRESGRQSMHYHCHYCVFCYRFACLISTLLLAAYLFHCKAKRWSLVSHSVLMQWRERTNWYRQSLACKKAWLLKVEMRTTTFWNRYHNRLRAGYENQSSTSHGLMWYMA